jgi:hypothetical protein
MSCSCRRTALLSAHAGFGLKQPHPPELAVGNNTGTNFSEPARRKACGFFMPAPTRKTSDSSRAKPIYLPGRRYEPSAGVRGLRRVLAG